jgi:hypothetical protein
MNRRSIAIIAGAAFALLTSRLAWPQESRSNHGDDPFFQVSHAVPGCPVPLGPLQTDAEWVADGHYRIERGNSCWWEGRCRLSSSYRYDKEIAESVRRRLAFIERTTHWRTSTTLWLLLQRRCIYVQGCVAPGFDKATFFAELAKTADVERVVDQTMGDTKAPPPYSTASDPARSREN